MTTTLESATTTTAALPCANCGAIAAGRFCAECGQERGELFPSVRSFVGEVFSEVLSIDGKLPRTLRALFWPPGRLTEEWYAGHRAPYASPLRLYLSTGLLFFLAWPLSPWSDGLRGIVNGWTDSTTDLARAVAAQRASSSTQLLTAILPSLLILCLVPLFAVLVRAVTGRSKRFVGSFVLALHTHAFAFSLTALAILARLLFGRAANSYTAPGVFVLLIAYLTATLARVHRYTMLSAFARTIAVVFAYLVVGVTVITIALAIVQSQI